MALNSFLLAGAYFGTQELLIHVSAGSLCLGIASQHGLSPSSIYSPAYLHYNMCFVSSMSLAKMTSEQICYRAWLAEALSVVLQVIMPIILACV